MDNSKHRLYPYKCAHLWHLWNIEKLTGKEMLERTVEMQFWLEYNCIVNGERTFIWDNQHSTFPFNYNKENNVSIYKAYSHEISLSNFIAFKHESDMLAFMLRWNIQNQGSAEYPKHA